MKKTGYTLFLLAVLLLSSCIVESLETTEEVIREVRGVMQIGIVDQAGEEEDKLHTIRFLVFKNISTSPKLELNELSDMPSVTTGGEITKFNVMLEVSRRVNGPNDKLVFAIVNEPTNMKTQLDNVTTYNDLQNLKLDFADFLNNDHTGLENNKGLPMTGVVLTNKVYATVGDAEADPEKLELKRAVAQVEVYIRKEDESSDPEIEEPHWPENSGLDTRAGLEEIDISNGTNITLKNTYDKEYFIYQSTSPAFGLIQTIPAANLINKTWTNTSGTKIIPVIDSEKDGLFVCSFYTPERTCFAPNDQDKLKLSINLKSSNGESREGEIIIKDLLDSDGMLGNMDAILRNNSYKILVTVQSNSVRMKFTIQYSDWQIHQQQEDFD